MRVNRESGVVGEGAESISRIDKPPAHNSINAQTKTDASATLISALPGDSMLTPACGDTLASGEDGSPQGRDESFIVGSVHDSRPQRGAHACLNIL